jgi:glycosyltransferase involved in cell wall biosynthesis
MPVHDRADYVEEACRSILAQTFRDFELVIIDDGSHDDSPRRLEALARQDARIRLTVRENRGLIASRNELLARARAPLVAWMDSDDVSEPRRLELQLARFDAEPALVCLGGAVLEIDGDGDPVRRQTYATAHETIVANLLQGGETRFPTTMMRRELALEVGGFREPFKVGEDLDLFLRLVDRGTFGNLEDVILRYRVHPGSTTSSHFHRWFVYRDTILALAAERRAAGSDRLQRGEPVTLGFDQASDKPDDTDAWLNRLMWARHSLEGGYPKTALKHAYGAVKLAPLDPRCWKKVARFLLTMTGLVAPRPEGSA